YAALSHGCSRTIVFLSIIRRPHSSTIFPYTTLFRSVPHHAGGRLGEARPARGAGRTRRSPHSALGHQRADPGNAESAQLLGQARSEEHTCELQSRGHLVYRLLLENKIFLYLVLRRRW